MNNIHKNLIRAGAIALLAACLPASAATPSNTDASCSPAVTSPQYVTTAKPTISGTASTSKKSLKVVVYKDGSERSYYTKSVKAKDCSWKAKVSKKLPDGEYRVEVVRSSSVIATSTLTVDVKNKNTRSSSVLAIKPIALLTGGNAKAGTTVPISYLQITNTGKATTTISGFWVKQNGSASGNAVIGLSTVDDRGGSRGAVGGAEGTVLFKNNQAFAPSAAVLGPGEMRLFTIKAQLTSYPAAHAGSQLMLDVVSVESSGSSKGEFPIRGTTWTIIR